MIRKKISLVSLLLVTSLSLLAQSNSYPTAGDVSIFNYSPLLVLQRNTDEGGFIQGVQTKFKNGTNNWYFGNLHSDTWIVSKGDYTNPKFAILQSGNVGIGTSTPSNNQGWNRVLDVSGTNHSKILATSENSLYKNGIFTHSSWHGGGGFIGTESNHSLFLLAGYDPKMTILTNGNVGIGTTAPQANLHIKYSNGISSAYLRLESLDSGQNASTQYVSGGLLRWELGTGISSGTNFELYDRINNKPSLAVVPGGNVGIGTTNPTSKLTVAGNINSREVKVSVDAGADFVFEKDYALPSLQEVEKFVTENKHLPEIASAKEMQKEGINLSEMNIKLLQKIEELMLYMIEQEKKNTIQSKEIEKLKKEKESYKIIFDRLTEIEKKLR